MAILAIKRDMVGEPNIVRVTTDDDLAAITAAGYLVEPEIAASIEALQHGQFEWLEGDLVAINYADGEGMFAHDAVDNTFVTEPAAPGTLSDALPNGQIFVGDATNIATGVAMTGAVTITNAGVTALANGAVTLAKLAAGVAPAGVVKYMGQVTSVGGAAAEAFVVTGAAAATDRAFVQVVDNGPNNVTVLQAVVTANTLTVTFSADPGAGALLNYQLLRAAA